MTSARFWSRSARLLATNKAVGKSLACANKPATRKHILMHTKEAAASNPSFAPVDVAKIGPAKWTHGSKCVCMLLDHTKCFHPDLPKIHDRNARAPIPDVAKQQRLVEYAKKAMESNVFPKSG